MTGVWPDWYRDQKVRGLGAGIKGRVGYVVSDEPFVSSFGHKWVEVKWVDGEQETQTVRTNYLDAVQ